MNKDLSLFDSFFLFEDACSEPQGDMDEAAYLFYDDEFANSNQFICSVAYICTDADGNELFREYELIDPECEFGYFESSKHGITKDDVVGKMNFSEFCDRSGFLELLKHCILVAHNAKGADCHHIRKSLARYGIDIPEIYFIDTQELADRISAFEGKSLEAACEYYDVPLRNHHHALEDAQACMSIYWKMAGELECIGEARAFEEPQIGWRATSQNISSSSSDTVHGLDKTIREVLAELEEEGRCLSREDIRRLGPCRMVFTGTACGMSKDAIKDYLVSKGYTVRGAVSGKTAFLAIGDNAGQTKIGAAFEHNTPVIALETLLEELNR